MILLRVQDIAQEKGLNLSRLQKKSNLDMIIVRRHWYCTQNGSLNGASLVQLNVHTLIKLARVLEVSVKDLFNDVR